VGLRKPRADGANGDKHLLVPPHLQWRLQAADAGDSAFIERRDILRLGNADDFNRCRRKLFALDRHHVSKAAHRFHESGVPDHGEVFGGRTIELDNIMYQTGSVSQTRGR